MIKENWASLAWSFSKVPAVQVMMGVTFLFIPECALDKALLSHLAYVSGWTADYVMSAEVLVSLLVPADRGDYLLDLVH